MFSYQWYYNFAIGVSLEVVRGLESLSNDSVVVDLAIDSKGNGLITVGKWLSSTIDTDNAQTLVGKDLKGLATPIFTDQSPILSYLCCWQQSFHSNLVLCDGTA